MTETAQLIDDAMQACLILFVVLFGLTGWQGIWPTWARRFYISHYFRLCLWLDQSLSLGVVFVQMSVYWNHWRQETLLTRARTISRLNALEFEKTSMKFAFYKWRVSIENSLRIGLKVQIFPCVSVCLLLSWAVSGLKPEVHLQEMKWSFFVFVCHHVTFTLFSDLKFTTLTLFVFYQSRVSILIQTIANLSTERMEGVTSYNDVGKSQIIPLSPSSIFRNSRDSKNCKDSTSSTVDHSELDEGENIFSTGLRMSGSWNPNTRAGDI
jgi:hypothetical protein